MVHYKDTDHTAATSGVWHNVDFGLLKTTYKESPNVGGNWHHGPTHEVVHTHKVVPTHQVVPMHTVVPMHDVVPTHEPFVHPDAFP